MSSPLIVVKSTSSYTTEFVGSTFDPCMTKGIINSSPDVYIKGNSFYFDYSGCKNSSDLKFLKKFFDNISTGGTFAFSSGVYFIEDTGEKINWNGQFTLRGKTGSFNEYLNFSGLTGTSSLTGPNYTSLKFISPIQYTAISGATAQYIQNHLPKDDPLNFKSLGIYGSDYSYEEYIQANSSSLNTGRIKVKNHLNLNDGSEIIYIDPSETVVSESLFFVNNKVDVLQRGNPDLSVRNTNQNFNGLLIKYREDNSGAAMLFDYQNRYQQACRQEEDPSNYYEWYSGFNLKNIKTTSIPFTQSGISINYMGFYGLKYVQNIGYSYNSDGNIATTTVRASQYEDFIYVDNILTNTLNVPFTRTPGSFRLDLSHSTNIGTTIKLFIDSNLTEPLEDNYYMIGDPGYEGAAFIYLASDPTAVRTIYMQLSRTSIKYLTINFV